MTLVSVVVPAHNAEASIGETLTSALRQTHRQIEVIVVDDGSTDRTGELAERFRAKDRRVKVVHTPNGGVARARNCGIEAASGDFIAPLDADDLWHPRKLELQLARFADAPADCGLVYNWFRRMDQAGVAAPCPASPRVDGWVPHRHLAWNFISNGSTPLIRRSALGELRYDPALHDAGAQGCEDYLLQLQIALQHSFAYVPAYLTGYRRAARGMSSSAGRMIRSHLQVFDIMAARLGPSAQRVAARRSADMYVQYARNRIRNGRFGEALDAIGRALALHPAAAGQAACDQVALALRTAARSGRPEAWRGGMFLDLDIEAGDGRWRPERWRLAAWIRDLDEAYGRSRRHPDAPAGLQPAAANTGGGAAGTI